MIAAKPLLDRTVAKITRRLLPFLLLMYVLSFLDRANIGFAKKAFQADTGIADVSYAFGAGIFFVSYALLEVPSNLLMHKVGARIWMCRIMVSWGLISSAMMFVRGTTTFYVLRLLLGGAEAGFFPGVILYLTYWIPAYSRARVMGLFYFGAPITFILGGPLSGILLELEGVAGLKGWQWMFLVEGLLASLVGVWAYWYLDDRPHDATWLSAEERALLSSALIAEERMKHARDPHGLVTALMNPRLLYLCLIYLLIQMSVYGVVFYLPTQVAGLLGTNVGFLVGLVTAIPWLCALCTAYLIPRWSDRTGKRRVTAAATLAAAGLGIAASAAASSPLPSLLALCVAAAGFVAVQPLFWTFPTGYLAGTAAAGGIALVNAIGALGGFVAPNVRVWAEHAFASPSAGLNLLATTTFAGAVLILGLGRVGISAQERESSNVSEDAGGVPQHHTQQYDTHSDY